MKIQNNTKSRQLLFAAVVLTAFFLLVYSCSLAKSKETKAIVYQLNEAKFQEGNDRKNAEFLVSSTEIYLHEIRLGQLAQAKARQIDVRELGKINEAYNTQKLIALMKLAKTKSISIPTSPNPENEKTFAKLAHKSATCFDKEYCDMLVNNHRRSMHFFETIASESTDEDIRNWATQALYGMNKQFAQASTCQKNCTTKCAF